MFSSQLDEVESMVQNQINHMKDKVANKDKALIKKDEEIEEITKELKALEGIRELKEEEHKEMCNKLKAKLEKSDAIIKRQTLNISKLVAAAQKL